MYVYDLYFLHYSYHSFPSCLERRKLKPHKTDFNTVSYHPLVKLKQQQKCELTYLAFYPTSSLEANYTDGLHHHWQLSFQGNLAWCM